MVQVIALDVTKRTPNPTARWDPMPVCYPFQVPHPHSCYPPQALP